jgi:hypothetical protein
MNFKPCRWFRTRNPQRTASRATPLRLESLEERVTPTANLRVNNAHFTAPAIGALTDVVVDFSTEGVQCAR